MKGKVWKFGSNVDTDVIIPGKYLSLSDPEELGKHCMEGIDEDFPRKINQGDIIVADENFGCGSSREHAPIAIKAINKMKTCRINYPFRFRDKSSRIFMRGGGSTQNVSRQIDDRPF